MDKQTVVEANKLLDKRNILLSYKDKLSTEPLTLTLDKTQIYLTQSGQRRLRETLVADAEAEIAAIEQQLLGWGVEL